MSDPKPPVGEPIDEPTPVDDVVGRAHEGLADAEAARWDDASAPEDSAPVAEPASVPEPAAPAEPAAPVASAPVEPAPVDAAPAVPAESVASASVPVDEPATTVYDAKPVEAAADPVDTTPWYDRPEADAYPTVVAPAVVEPVAEMAPASPQPIFVQAPEAPHPKGNRAAAGAIGLLAALSFAVLYLLAWLGIGLVDGSITSANVADKLVGALGTWALWVPVVVFFIAFWLLGAIINRGRWGVWVVLGLLVGLAAYGGHLLGQLFQAPFWNITASEGSKLVEGQLFAPLAIAAFVIGRELTIWFGSWAAARGRRMTELNLAAQHEYERTLEAGPQLAR
jgi:hypothetical protein